MSKDSTQRAIVALQEERAGPKPDVAPVMRNVQLPFKYPPALYEQKVQGNVTLHIRIDSLGAVVPESTKVAEPSGIPGLDSAAVSGSRLLSFVPGTLKGKRIPVSVLLPVFFRHPKGAPLPGDSVLRPRGAVPRP
ncbi:MAG: energy transducer TonB [Gemmatimonadota bacterium]|nr:energy transducer TonB [Gemmatimonadota bacterium]